MGLTFPLAAVPFVASVTAALFLFGIGDNAEVARTLGARAYLG